MLASRHGGGLHVLCACSAVLSCPFLQALPGQAQDPNVPSFKLVLVGERRPLPLPARRSRLIPHSLAFLRCMPCPPTCRFGCC